MTTAMNPDLIRLYEAGKAVESCIDDAIMFKAASRPPNDELDNIFPSLTPAQTQRVRRNVTADLASKYVLDREVLQVAYKLAQAVDHVTLWCGQDAKDLVLSQMEPKQIVRLFRFRPTRLRKTIARIRQQDLDDRSTRELVVDEDTPTSYAQDNFDMAEDLR
jgi:hypothetical protein